MDEKILMNRYEFGSIFTECDKYRAFKDLDIVSTKSDAYDNAIGMLDIIKLVCWEKEYTPDDIFELCSQVTGYEADITGATTVFNAEKQALKLETKRKAFRYTRYCKSELSRDRENLMYSKDLPELEIEIGNIVVPVRPHALFMEKLTPFGCPSIIQIEAVFYADKKAPSGVTNRYHIVEEVKKWEDSMKKREIEFEKTDPARLKNVHLYKDEYLALKYAEKLIKDESWLEVLGIDAEEAVSIVGAVYHMRMKSQDNQITDFFGGGSNIITLSESRTAGVDESPTALDLLFNDYSLKHELGISADKCSKEDCKYCSNNMSCNFQKTPVLLEKDNNEVSSNASKYFQPTEPQKSLISLKDGYNLCIARAGSGKTASLKELVLALLHDGADLSEIFMTTFTNNGVKEFKERLLSSLREEDPSADIEKAIITTFHGFALDIVRDNFSELGFTAPPREINEVDNARIIEDLVNSQKISGAEDLYKKNYEGVLNITDITIKIFNIYSEHPEYSNDQIYAELSSLDKGKILATSILEIIALYPEYIENLKNENVVLFSQMEPMMHKILDNHPGYLDQYGFKYVILDEFQDSNEIQMKTVKKLAECPSVEMIVAVGDDGQSIYGFRDACVENIVHFEEKLGLPVNKIEMLENWRSTPEILSLADDLLELNKEKTEGRSIAGRPSGAKPVVKGFHSEDEEYSFIVQKIKENHDNGIPYDHQAFIARTNKELVRMISILANNNIPYVLKNPMKLMDNSRVQAAVSFAENVFWQPETSAGLFAYLSALYDGDMLDKMDAEDVQEKLLELKGRFRNIENMSLNFQRKIFHDALDAIRGNDEIYCSFLDDYLYAYGDIEEELKFIGDFKRFGSKLSARMEQDYEGVVLTTAHSSKGLEWDVVYNSVSCFDTKILHSSRHHDEVEETRRLLYVSMTRARDILYVTGRYIVDGTKSSSLSDGGPLYNQFLKELIILSGQVYNPVDPEAERKKQERELKAQKRRSRSSHSNSKARAMTKEEIERYEKTILGSYQTSLKI